MARERECEYGGLTVDGLARQPPTLHLVRAVALCFLIGLHVLWAATPAKSEIVVALDGEILPLDPFAHSHTANAVIDWLIHDQLFFRDGKTLRPVPSIAESLKPIDDVTWEIKLRPGIRFHNGEPVDAAAVKFTLERLLQMDQKSPSRSAFAWVKEVELVNDLVVRLHAHRPVPSLPDLLTRLHILPPRYLAEVGEARFAEAPVGAGPYRVSAWSRPGPLTLQANEGYWGGPKGRPSIRTIIFRTILDQAQRFNKLLSESVHIARGLTIDQAMLLNHADVARTSAKPTPRVVFLLMDGDGRASKTPLTERRVRRAISYAIPIEEMVNTVLHKFAVRAPGGLTPLHFGYDTNIHPRPYDLQKARALLQEAGHSEGFELPLNFSPAVLPGAERLAASILDSLEKIGVRVKIRRFADAHEFDTQFRQGKLEGLSLLAWGSGASFDADAILYPLFRSGQGLTYNANPDVDKLLDEGRATIDPEKRKAIYSAVQKLILDQAYWVPLYGQYILEGVNRKLDYEASSDELMYLFSATWKGNHREE
ncbi:MAG TPA: ABC transporter substrate-binding protein [Alphaproteobacteria bacterium]|nr:ABC transporter substrate-binding protein [Alphaproteobacteria bacterium]